MSGRVEFLSPALAIQWKAKLRNDVEFETIYCRVYRHEFMMLSNILQGIPSWIYDVIQYIAGYTVMNLWCYPIRHHITLASVLDRVLFELMLYVPVNNFSDRSGHFPGCSRTQHNALSWAKETASNGHSNSLSGFHVQSQKKSRHLTV